MESLTFPGGYQDEADFEAIRWRVESMWQGRYLTFDLFTTIRGIDVRGSDFDSMERPAGTQVGANAQPVAGLRECCLPGRR